MDSPSSENSGRLSLSLISYGSDDEDIDSITAVTHPSSDTLVPDGFADTVQKGGQCDVNCNDEEDLVMFIAKQVELSGVNRDKLCDFSCALGKMREAHQKYIEKKLVFDTIKDILKSPATLPAETVLRANKVLDHISLLDYAVPSDTDSTDGVFGISQNHLQEYLPNELTAVDIKHLREIVERGMASKHEQLLEMDKRHSDIISGVSGPLAGNISNCIEQKSTHELLSLRQDLDREISAHERYLADFDKVLSNLSKMKLETFDHINTNRVKNIGRKCEVLKTQIQSLNKQIVSGIYHEDQHLIEAHTNLKKSLDLAVDEAKTRLLLLQKTDADYEKLQGTHFDRLVKEYNEVKAQIAQKEYALKTLLGYAK